MTRVNDTKRFHGCTSKRRFDIRLHAELEAYFRGIYRAQPHFVYRCALCDGYHLTRQRPSHYKKKKFRNLYHLGILR